jgi:DNA-binding NarL/FixJ family response regulator
MPSSLVPFVGRAAEVAAVTAALDSAAAGAASVVAVAGEPGVGKSRLVDEADTASPLYVDLPYGIVVEALRPIMRTVEAGARTRLVEGLPDLAADRHLLSIGDVCQAMILLGRGDGESALRVARSIQPSGLANPALCLGVLGEAQVAAGDPAGARETATSLARHGPDAPYPAAVAARIVGLAARAEGDAEAASEAFERAANGLDALGMPFDAAVARLDWAETDGTDRVRDDLQLFDRLGARPAADRARQLLRRLGIRPTVASRTRQADELSPREAEIAQLVAEGLSNMEIAERLFISHRTVTTHLQRIYQRLGVTSRTGLTRYVLEQPRNT